MQTSFEYVSAFFIASGFLCGFIMLADIFNNRPQKIKTMNSVWFLTGIWASWIGLYVYFKIGRANKIKNDNEDSGQTGGGNKIVPARTNAAGHSFLPATLQYGAGCVLANTAAESLTVFYPVALPEQWILDYILALVFSVGFQYAAIRPAKTTDMPGKTIRKAFKNCFPVTTAWQAGVFAYSALIFFGFHDMIEKNSWNFWFMMQLAMFCGCLTAYPVKGLLIKTYKSDKGERPLKHYSN